MKLKIFLLTFVFCLGISGLSGQALEHKPNQLFISPVLSLGTPFILNQTNYGFSELKYELTFGGQFGIMVGWDQYLKNSLKTGIMISNWGQNYHDVLWYGFAAEKKINNYYLQIPGTYKHVFGRKRGYDHEVFNPYVFGSVLISYLLYSDVKMLEEQEDGSFLEVTLIDFVTDNSWNLNSDEIIAQGNPEKDKHLFSPFDVNIDIGGGFQYFVTRLISVFAEGHVTGGILDINAGKWRFRDRNNVYRGSHNFYIGINIGANFYLNK